MIFDLLLCENSSGGDNECSELRDFVVARGDDGSSLCETDDEDGDVGETVGSEMAQGDSADREPCWQDVEDDDDGKKASGSREASLQPMLCVCGISTKLLNDCGEVSLNVRPGAAEDGLDAGTELEGTRVVLLYSAGEV